MDPISLGMAASYPAAIAFNGLTNLINGKRSLAQQAKFQEQNRQDADRRFGADLDLRERQFVFTQEEAQAAVMRRLQERMEDFSFRRQERIDDRAAQSLSRVFNGSLEMLGHDPYAQDNPGVKSFRVMFMGIKNMNDDPRAMHILQADIERGINSAAREYMRNGDHQPIHFPSGVAIPGSQSGAWLASQLHAIDPETPTLLMRLEKTGDAKFVIQVDLYGFPMGDSTFEAGADLGQINTSDPQTISQILSLITLGAADMYYLKTYTTAPLLPRMLSGYLPAPEDQTEETRAAIHQIVSGYQHTLNSLMKQTPEAAAYAAIQLAEALTSLPDKGPALDQIRQVEAMTGHLLPANPEVVAKLQELYVLAGAKEEAERLAQKIKDMSALPPGPAPDLGDLI